MGIVRKIKEYLFSIKQYYRRIKFQNRNVVIHTSTKLGEYLTLNKLETFPSFKSGRIEIGKGCKISNYVTLQAYVGYIEISENTFIGENVVIYGHGGVNIGKNSLIAMNTCIVSSNHTIPSSNELIINQPDKLLPTKIGDDVWIGANVTVLGGVKISNGVVVGAGSVVTKDIPPYCIAVGNPAKVIRTRQ